MHELSPGTFILPRPPKATRRITMGVKEHFTGSLITGVDEGEIIELQSHTERQVALVMLAREEVVDLESQVEFKWIDGIGKSRTHFFDFRVSLCDGTRVALIVKNSRKAAKSDFIAEMRQLAQQVTLNFADRVSLVTEKHIDPVELHNAELFHSVRPPDPDIDAAVRKVIAGVTGAVKIKDIVSACALPGCSFLSVVRMIAEHELGLVSHERIEPETFVRRRFI